MNSRPPIQTAYRFISAAVCGHPRCFSRDARRAIASWSSYHFLGEFPDLKSSEHGWLIMINHYTRPGFEVWWNAFVLSAFFPEEITWITTSVLEWDGSPIKLLFRPFTRWFLRRLGKVYGFIQMPPMPPKPDEMDLRVIAIRTILETVRRSRFPIIGLAPEGADWNDGSLMRPYPGTGRFLASLARENLTFLPVGTYEIEDQFYVRPGSPFQPVIDPAWSPQEQDFAVIDEVMTRIAACRPPEMRVIRPPRPMNIRD